MGAGVAPKVPGRTGVTIKGVGFARHLLAVNGHFKPIFGLSEGGATGVVGLIIVYLRDQHRELIFGNRVDLTILIIGDRNWAAPVALAGNQPVAHPVGDFGATNTLTVQPGDNLFTGVFAAGAVELAGVDELAFAVIAAVGIVTALGLLNHLLDWQVKLLGELKVAFIVTRNGHNRAGAVAHEDVVGHPNRNRLTGGGVDGVTAGEDAGFGFVLLAFNLGFLEGSFAILVNLGAGARRGELGDQRMLGRQHQEGSTEDGVGAGSKDGDEGGGWIGGVGGRFISGSLNAKINLRTFAAADPVLLHGLNLFGPFYFIQRRQQLVGVIGDFEEPLLHFLLFYFGTTAPAMTVLNLLVGQHGLVNRAPPLVAFLLVGEAGFVELEEAPLGPAVVFGVGSVDFAAPVNGVTELLGLFAEVLDVGGGSGLRRDAGFDGVILGGQTKGVIAEGAKNVHALLGIEAGEHINNGEVADMTNVKTSARGVGEHFGDEFLGARVADWASLKCLSIGPDFLPF